MKRESSSGTRKKIAMAAVIVCAALGLLTYTFIRDVKTQLWEQSINTIMESTRQGSNTLRVQLNQDFESMGIAAENIRNYSMLQGGQLKQIVENYSKLQNSATMYVKENGIMTIDGQGDYDVEKVLLDTKEDKGIINPHISSVTGVSVFNLFVKTVINDNTELFIVKEYEISRIVDSFTLSFYNDAGFSYVINTKGDVLIRPSHPNSNKTIQNLFDMLPESENDPESIEELHRSLEESRTGWAVFNFNGDGTVLCYTPLGLQSDWYLISIIPKSVVNEQTNEILIRSMLLIGSIILGISVLAIIYSWYAGKAHKRIRNQAEYTEHLYNAIPEAVALLTVQQPYHIIQLNQEGRLLLGWEKEYALSDKRILQDMIYQDDYDDMIVLLDNLDEDKVIFECRMTGSEEEFLWTSGIIEKTHDENGIPVLIVAFHDITKEKAAEEAEKREQKQERLTLVGAISNVYPVIINMNLTKDFINFVYVKPGLMLDIGKQKTYTRLYEDVASTIHPDNKEEFNYCFSPAYLNKVLGTEEKEVFLEVRQMLTDGQYHWVSMQIIYVDNPYSEDKLAIIISRRIDEKRYGEEQQRQALQSALDSARAASKAKGQFLSNMSHDIRTPMNAIVGMTAIAAAHLDDKAKVVECLNKIDFSSRHLLSLINDILDISRIESGKVSLREEEFDLEDLVSDVTELMRMEADAKRLKMTVTIDKLKNKKVIGDPLRIRQIIINILSNAVKYTLEEGCINVNVKQENSILRGHQSYIFTCADTGIGMDKKFLERLFDPFERVQDSTTSTIMGTGLGMAITKNLVDLMNGEIIVESILSEGSTFIVNIPLKLQTSELNKVASVNKPEKPIENALKDYGGKRILLVEDNDLNREIARELIAGVANVQIEEALDGEEAVKKISESTEKYYDLIFMDIQMPKMNGYEASRAIRALARKDAKDIPIVAMTANAFEEDVRMAMRAGMNAHFSKPIEMQELRQIIHKYL